MLEFWKWRYVNERTGKETASCLESINVEGMCLNSVHLHVHSVALLSPLIVLFWPHLSFLKTKTKRERVQVARKFVNL